MQRSSSGVISLPASAATSPASTRGRCKSESDSKASLSHKLKKKLDIPAAPLSKPYPLIDICNTSLSKTLLTQTKDSKPSKSLKKSLFIKVEVFFNRRSIVYKKIINRKS